ncbi:MAG: thioredoxin domain-containing protein [Pseudomonadota bacterium]
MTESPDRNLLRDQTSPYLLQHADNPVHWFPWGSEALEAAKTSNKPVLLSIGYSACHWCHVMAHESFEHPDTAALMNELFVNVKVDREERPDIDNIYQTAHQLLTQQAGGWPLTVFLDADTQLPFFSGTYFPFEARHGMPSFRDLLRRVHAYYKDHQQEIATQQTALRNAFSELQPQPGGAQFAPGAGPLDSARAELAGGFDSEFGGFGSAPKFPHPPMIERALRHWRLTAASDTPDVDSLFMAVYTLKRLALGGVNDQLGGGFFRYSVDRWWMIPHFEKMLYDSAGLLALFAQAWLATGERLFERVARETATWIMRDMQSPGGGYFSSLDADSEGGEGGYYVWRDEELRSALSHDEYRVVAARFGLDSEPNFEGQWHLHVFADDHELTEKVGLDAADTEALLDSARNKLLTVRGQRPKPARDEKILTSWNALTIRAMAIAALALDDPHAAQSAGRALAYVEQTLWKDKRLLATARDDQAHLDAYLDDYAFLIDAILTLLQVRWRSRDLAFAIELADELLARFQAEGGGFFFTADDHEALMHRAMPLADAALPSGNGIAALALNRLGALLGETRYEDAARNTLAAAWPQLEQAASAHCTLMHAHEETLHPPEIVIIRGSGPEAAEWQRTAASLYAPRRLVFAVPADATDLPPAIAVREARDGVVAYVCQGNVCSAPLTTLEAFGAALSEA